MDIVDTVKFAIGILLAVVGVAVLVAGRSSRGFDQRRQAGVLFLIVGAAFVGAGLGLWGR